jgi:hypothetical protein
MPYTTEQVGKVIEAARQFVKTAETKAAAEGKTIRRTCHP